jgi:hypothetical protein
MNNLIDVLRKCITGLLEAEAKVPVNWDYDATYQTEPDPPGTVTIHHAGIYADDPHEPDDAVCIIQTDNVSSQFIAQGYAEYLSVACTARNLHRPTLEYMLTRVVLPNCQRCWGDSRDLPCTCHDNDDEIHRIARIFADDPGVRKALEELECS